MRRGVRRGRASVHRRRARLEQRGAPYAPGARRGSRWCLSASGA